MKSRASKKVQKDKNQSKKASGNATLGKWNEMNRKQRREMMRKMQNEDLNLEVVHPDAAGIDIGNESHYVAVPPSRDLKSAQKEALQPTSPSSRLRCAASSVRSGSNVS